MAEVFLLPAFANATTSFATVVHCRAMGAGNAEIHAMMTDPRAVDTARAFLCAQSGGVMPKYKNTVDMFLAAYLGAVAGDVPARLASGDATMRAAGEAGRRLALASVALLGEVQRMCEDALAAAKRDTAAARARAKAARARLGKARAGLEAAARCAAALPAQLDTGLPTPPAAALPAAGFRALLDAHTAAMAVGRAAELVVHERHAAIINKLRSMVARLEGNTDPANAQQMQSLREKQQLLAFHEAHHAQWTHALGLARRAAGAQ